MVKDSKGTDLFMLAWGEMSAWRGAAAKAQLLSLIHPELIEWDPAVAVRLVHAAGVSSAVRDYIVGQIDILVPDLGMPYLHKALRSFRHGQRGPRSWRRYCLRRAMSYGPLVEEELKQLSAARVQMESWERSLLWSTKGVRQALEMMNGNEIPEEHVAEWELLRKQLQTSEAGMALLRERLKTLIGGIGALISKATLFTEAWHSTPAHEDVLKSESFKRISSQLLSVSSSGLPLSDE